MLIFNLLMAAGQGGQMLAVGQNSIVGAPKFFRVGVSTAQQVTVTGIDPGNSIGLVAFSEDGNTMAASDSGGQIVYSREGLQFTPKTDDLTSLPGIFGFSFSPDGTFLAVVGGNSPFLKIYKRGVDGEYDALPTVASPPPNDGNGCAFSPDGAYLAVAHDDSPYLTIYSVSGDTFTKLSNPSTLPAGDASSVKWSTGGTYLVVTLASSPYVYVYKRSGSTFTKLGTPTGTTLMTGGNTAAFSPDSSFLAVGFGSTKPMFIYQRTNDTFSKVAELSDIPSQVLSCAWSPDSNFLALGGSGDILTIYRKSDTSLTKINIITSETLSQIFGLGFFPPGIPGSG